MPAGIGLGGRGVVGHADEGATDAQRAGARRQDVEGNRGQIGVAGVVGEGRQAVVLARSPASAR